MNKNDFLSLIGSRNPIDRQVLAELNELVNIFPYFQTAHLLLLKGLQDNSDIRFENQLRNSAIHLADREVLYNLLRIIPGSMEQESPVEIQDIEIQIPVSKIETATDVDMEQTVIQSAKNSEDLIVEIEKDSITVTESGRDDEADHVINRSILASIETDDYESIERNVVLIEEESSGQEEKIFYMDPGFSAPEQEETSELDTITSEETQPESLIREEAKLPEFIEQENTVSGQTPEEERRRTQSDLIDKFISASPRIEPRREISDQPNEDLANQFTEEKGGFITETLARIYITQGYYSKAIDIYEKLSLKFPEKSGYFAAQIENIKAIIK